MRAFFAIPIVLSIGFLSGSPCPGEAQILNTLRGFSEDTPGWSGRAEGAVAMADGNTEYLEISVGASVQYQYERQRWRLLGRASRRTSGGVETAESSLAHLRHNYRIQGPVSSVAFLQGQVDPFRDLETRILAGAGVRVDLHREPGWSAGVGATIMREDEKLTGSSDFHTTARFSVFLSLYRKAETGPGLDLSVFFQPAVEDFSDARALANASLEFDVVGNLYFGLNYALEYDSDPPGGVEEVDQTLRSGFGYRL